MGRRIGIDLGITGGGRIALADGAFGVRPLRA
jgi:hypothetical protein